jgi:hypothetical protein
MTRKRKLILTTVVLAAGVGVWAGLHFLDRRDRLARSQFIDEEHCLLIHDGMGRKEVEVILGGAAGDFRTKQVEYWHTCPLPLDFKSRGRGRWEWWTGNEGQIEILFDEQDTVEFLHFAAGSHSPSLIEQVRDWLCPPAPKEGSEYPEFVPPPPSPG